MVNYNFGKMNNVKLGHYAEALLENEFNRLGFSVYIPSVDDHGIDFLLRSKRGYEEIQVKSVRNFNYIFFDKNKFKLSNNLFAGLVLFQENQPPSMYLIPSNRWYREDELFISRDYVGKKSKPEWGIRLTKKRLHMLEKYSLENTVRNICMI